MSTPARVTRALLALQALLEEQLPRELEATCRKACTELALHQKVLALRTETEDPWGNLR
jgi:hypothetical protein